MRPAATTMLLVLFVVAMATSCSARAVTLDVPESYLYPTRTFIAHVDHSEEDSRFFQFYLISAEDLPGLFEPSMWSMLPIKPHIHVLGFDQLERIREFSLDIQVHIVDPSYDLNVEVLPTKAHVTRDSSGVLFSIDYAGDPAWFYQHWLDGLAPSDPYDPVCSPVWDEHGDVIDTQCYPYPRKMTQAERDIYFPIDPMPEW